MAERVRDGMKRLSWTLGVLGIVCWGGVFGRWLFVSWDDLRPKDTIPPKIEGMINKARVEAEKHRDEGIEKIIQSHREKDKFGGINPFTKEQLTKEQVAAAVKELMTLTFELGKRTFKAKRDSITTEYFAQLERTKEKSERKLKVYMAMILPSFLLPWGLVRAFAWVAAGFKKEQR